ncbi:MAG: glutaredoxin family protein [candidate division WOR-3 bacterium]
MAIIHVPGKDKGKIFIFALSTCVWCKKTKKFFSDHQIAYDYVDVDLLSGEEREQTLRELKKWNERLSFPTIVINNKDCILGYDQEKLDKLIHD